MADLLRPGTSSETINTMAKAMEEAFLDQWPAFNPKLPLPDEKGLQPMRLFFVAISQGVVQHLRDNKEAFEVEVEEDGTTLEGTVVQINTTGTTS
jgi:hypothetical protein